MVLAHDVTEIRKGDFKGRAFKRGHIITAEDVCHFQRLGKEHVFIMDIAEDEMHEDEASLVLAEALMGEGVRMEGEPREGRINIVAAHDGLLKVDSNALFAFNLVGEVACATLHGNTVVTEGQRVAGTRAIPLVVNRKTVEEATDVARASGGVLAVKAMRAPKAGVVITGNEVYRGLVPDAFAPAITEKIECAGGSMAGILYAPDDEEEIVRCMKSLLDKGANFLITTGGMSVDPDDVTRFAIKSLGATDMTYGSPVLPGSMLLVAYLERSGRTVPVLGIPACAIYHKMTVFDLILPRVLAGELIGHRELAALGHGGLCLNCERCNYPTCPFGK
ncbi:MAG: molybdopterin-binding protein [Nitrospirota bacterium]